jgi:hypothetical protein
MQQYKIRTTHDDMPDGYEGIWYKWAHNELDAINLLLKKKRDKSGLCVFKRGGTGSIISTEEIKCH